MSFGKPASRSGGAFAALGLGGGLPAVIAWLIVYLHVRLCASPRRGAGVQCPVQCLAQSMTTGRKKGGKECIFPSPPQPGLKNSTTHNGATCST